MSVFFSLTACSYLDQLLNPTQDLEAQDAQEQELKHPTKETRWETQALLLSNELPDKEDMQKCIAQVHETSKFMQNEDELIAAKKRLQLDIKDDLETYHWCFYQMVENMDNELNKSELTYRQKMEIFENEMEGLWMLARSLDEISGNEKDMPYFSYLRARYIELSRALFGRRLDVISLPMDLRRSSDEKAPEASDKMKEE